jgi:hypothetical protein
MPFFTGDHKTHWVHQHFASHALQFVSLQLKWGVFYTQTVAFRAFLPLWKPDCRSGFSCINSAE